MKHKAVRTVAQAVLALSRELPPEEHSSLLDAALALIEESGLIREMKYFPRILSHLVHESWESVTATLVTPEGSSGTSGQGIASRLGSILKKKVVLEEQSDPRILGGALLSYGDERFDASLRGALDQCALNIASCAS